MKLFNKNKIILTIIGSLLLILIISGGFLIWNYNIGKNKELEENFINNNKVDNSMFVIMLEQEDGTYDKSNSNIWPTGYKYDKNKSGCIDVNGKNIDNVLSYNEVNNKVVLRTIQATMCYLYFTRDKSVYAKLVSDYTNSNGADKISSTSAETGNTYDVFYYKYNATNNNILFGGFCWHMVITTETKGVKLIYNGVPTTETDSEGNTTYNCNNTGTASQIGTSKFNSSSNSMAYSGYMYNTVYLHQKNDFKQDTLNVLTMDLVTESYYYGDKAVWNPNTNEYDLKTSDDADITTTTKWSSSTYTSLIGKYTCKTIGTKSCAWPVYIVGGNSSDMYYYRIGRGNTNDDYNLKLSTTVTDNGDGTYTLNNPIEITRSEYYNNYSKYINYYYCKDLISETCSDMYYSVETKKYYFKGINRSNEYRYGNSFTYDSSTGIYTLIDTEVSSIKQFWDWKSNYDKLSNNHYTCLNTSGECTNLYYIFYATKSTAYFIILTNGKPASDALNEMLNGEVVNTTDSTIKDYIDIWYEDNLLETKDEKEVLYSKYLENAIFCNNRENTYLGGWDPNGGKLSTSYNFNRDSLECINKTDRFTLKKDMGGIEGYGNNALDYPIALLSYKEAHLVNNIFTNGYLNTGQSYWLITPYGIHNGYNISVGVIYSDGSLKSLLLHNNGGVRPVVSLSKNVEITNGDGTVTNPYQIELAS